MSHHLVTLCRSRLFLFVFYIGNLKVNSSWGSRQNYTHKRQSFLCDMIRYILKDAIFWINPDLHDQLQLFNGLSYFFAATPILFLLSHDWSTEKTAFLAALRTRLLAMLARWNLLNTLLFFASLCSIWFSSILLLNKILP